MSTRRVVVDALFIAIIMIVTMVITIPMLYGYINLSDCLIMMLGTCLNIFDLFLVSAIGPALADLFLGYSQYAIFTFFVKGIEALIVFGLLKRIDNKLLAFIVGALWMLCGYGISDMILGSNITLFIPSVLANLPQALASILIAIVLYKPFDKFIGSRING